MNIAIICADNHSLDMNDWHHYGFWKRTVESYPNVTMSWFTWSDWKTMPKGLDLYLFLDFRYCLWELARPEFDWIRPRALYWWDAFHAMFSLVAQTPLVFDRVYTAELVDAQHLKICGFQNAEWLPAAFYPELYRSINVNKDKDFAFVGQLDSAVVRKSLTRFDTINELSKRFKGFVSSNCRGPSCNEAYNRSKILVERTIFANVGTRLFETVGSGGFCLMNRFPCATGLDLIGIDGVHFVTYDESLEDLVEKTQYYLSHDEERENIARSGHEHFLAHHTYKHRFERILRDFSLGG
jgi:hypothetical protein